MDELINEYKNTRKKTRTMYTNTTGEDKKKWGQMLRNLDWTIYYMEQGKPPDDFPPYRMFGRYGPPTILDDYMHETSERVGDWKMTSSSLFNAVSEDAYDAYVLMAQDYSIYEIADLMEMEVEAVQELLDTAAHILEVIMEERS